MVPRSNTTATNFFDAAKFSLSVRKAYDRNIAECIAQKLDCDIYDIMLLPTQADPNHFYFACIPEPKSTDFRVSRFDRDHEGIYGIVPLLLKPCFEYL